jgi:hypothetical protein
MDPTTVVLDSAAIAQLYVGDENAEALRDLPEFIRGALIRELEALARIDRELLGISLQAENEVYAAWLSRRHAQSVSGRLLRVGPCSRESVRGIVLPPGRPSACRRKTLGPHPRARHRGSSGDQRSRPGPTHATTGARASASARGGTAGEGGEGAAGTGGGRPKTGGGGEGGRGPGQGAESGSFGFGTGTSGWRADRRRQDRR